MKPGSSQAIVWIRPFAMFFQDLKLGILQGNEGLYEEIVMSALIEWGLNGQHSKRR
jgi:hypothetical protein